MTIRRAAAVLLAGTFTLGLTACQEQVPTDTGSTSGSSSSSESSESSSSKHTPLPRAKQVHLSENGGVNSMTLPSSMASVEREVSTFLGKPTRRETSDDSFQYANGRTESVHFGGLVISGESPKGSPAKAESWSMSDKNLDVVPPFGIQPGDDTSGLEGLKGAERHPAGPTHETPYYEKGKLTWELNAAGTKVQAIHYNRITQ